jgi:hypothetical protein
METWYATNGRWIPKIFYYTTPIENETQDAHS